MALIQDVRPAPKPDAKIALAIRQADINYIAHVDTGILVTEIAARGVTIHDIFGMYYALEQMSYDRDDQLFGSSEEGNHGRLSLTVADAELADAVPELPPSPVNLQPF